MHASFKNYPIKSAKNFTFAAGTILIHEKNKTTLNTYRI